MIGEGKAGGVQGSERARQGDGRAGEGSGRETAGQVEGEGDHLDLSRYPVGRGLLARLGVGFLRLRGLVCCE